MNRDQLVAQAREWLDDERKPHLWGDESLHRWLNEAQDEAALRTRSLVDDSTPDVCTVQVVAGTAVYRLHPAIVVVRRYEYRRTDALPEVLKRHTSTWMDRNFGGNWTAQGGRPWIVVPNLNNRTFRLDRIPTSQDVGTIQLQVWRKPLEAERLEVPDDEPVLDEAFHLNLVHWVCHRAFLKRDAETHNPTASAEHLSLFEAAFGSRPTLQRLIELSTDDCGEVEAYW